MPLTLRRSFDQETFRHFLGESNIVMHCHHYMSLTSLLAEQFADIGGPRILRETAEDTLRPLMEQIIHKDGVQSPDERLAIGRELYSYLGLGKMEVDSEADGSAKITLIHSHVDEGWVKKWGPHKQPINHFTCGYLAAMFGVAFNRPARSFKVVETSSMVTGSATGQLKVTPT